MAILKKFADLDTSHRGEPCQEYPGEWLVYADGKEVACRPTFNDAYSCADAVWNALSDPGKVSVCWSASADDPRIGEVWFTSFYQHGWIDSFGTYRT